MFRRSPALPALILLLIASMTLIARGDDSPDGAKIYLKCRSCHELTQPTHKMGPHLVNLLGRQAGSIAGFRYSDAMRRAGEDGLIWNEETLKAFLASPKTVIPQTSMRFWGLWPQQIEALLRFLKQQPQHNITP